MAFMLGYSRGLYQDGTGDLIGYKDFDSGEFLFARKATYGVFTSDQNQSQESTPEKITFNATALSSGISLSGTTKIVVSRAGLYTFHLSVHVHNDDNDFNFFDMWGRLNNSNIPGSRFKYSVPRGHGQQEGSLTPSQNFYLNLDANDEVEIVWTTNEPNKVTIAKHDAETTPVAIPAAPSVMLTVSEIAHP
jgi:hypothetical protein